MRDAEESFYNIGTRSMSRNSWSTPEPMSGFRIMTAWLPLIILPRIDFYNQGYQGPVSLRTCVKSIYGAQMSITSTFKAVIFK